MKVPHVLYDSLYVKAQSPLPPYFYFFAKNIGMPVNSLWYSDGWGDVQVGPDETNLQRCSQLPEPETFAIRRAFLCVDDTREPEPAWADCEYDIRIGRRSCRTGCLQSLDWIRDSPLGLFQNSCANPGSLNPDVTPNMFPGGLDTWEEDQIVPPGMYFSVEVKGTKAKVLVNTKIWFCLYGLWDGPTDSGSLQKIANPVSINAQRVQ